MSQRHIERQLPPELASVAERRAKMRAFVAVAVAAALEVPVCVVSIADNVAAYPLWWLMLAGLCLALAAAVAVAVVSNAGKAITHLATILLVLLPLGYVTEYPALRSVDPTAMWQIPTLWALEPVAMIAAVLTWPIYQAYAYGLLSVLSVPTAALLSGTPTQASWWGIMALHAGNLCFIAYGNAIHKQMVLREVSQEFRHLQVNAAARSAAWHRERTRLDSIIHDEVLSTLLSTVHGRNEDAGRLAERAKATLELLKQRLQREVRTPDVADTHGGAPDGKQGAAVNHEGTEDLTSDGTVNPDEFHSSSLSRRIHTLAHSYAVPVTEEDASGGEKLPHGDLHIPADATDALVEAATQALENAQQHAQGAAVLLRLRLTDNGVNVVISDAGPGFDPEKVDPRRFGIRTSIIEKMESVAGGEAKVRSGSRGTTVELSYRPNMPSQQQRPNHAPAPESDHFENQWFEREGEVPDSRHLEPLIARNNHRKRNETAAFERLVVETSGPASTELRVVLMLLWVIGTMISVPDPTLGSHWPKAITAVLIGLASLASTTKHARLKPWHVAAVLTNTVAATVFTLTAVTEFPSSQPWAWQMSGNICGLVAMRGNTRLALVCFAFQSAGLGVWAAANGPMTSAQVIAATAYALSVSAGLVWNALVRRNLTTIIGRLDTAAQAQINREATAHAIAQGDRLVDRVQQYATPALEQIANLRVGVKLTDALRLRSEIAEASVRDLIRAPRLTVPPLEAACYSARLTGVDVRLYDDGAEATPLPELVLDDAARLIIEAAEHGASGILLRALPQGRPDLLVLRAEGLPEDGAHGAILRQSWPALPQASGTAKDEATSASRRAPKPVGPRRIHRSSAGA